MKPLVFSLLVLLAALADAPTGVVVGQGVAAQPPPRDAPLPRAGTGVISGVVTAADTGLPLRQATVMLMMQGVGGRSSTRTAATDITGRFEFTGVPAGSHTLRADPGPFRGQYVNTSYGAESGSTGRQVVLTEGQRFEQAHIELARGGVVEGRVTDDFGDPVTRVRVYAARLMGGSSLARIGPGAETDDQGRFRLYGIPPGDYIVVAESRDGGRMPITEGTSEGFATTFFPSALAEREATRVRIAAGREVRDLHIQLARTRLYRITGRVLDSSGRLIPQPSLTLMRAAPGGLSGFSGGGVTSPGERGMFTIRDVLPGEYRLVIRPQPFGAFGTPSAAQAGQDKPALEYASVPLHVQGDVEDLVIVTQPGATVTGTVVFADGEPTKPPPMRVTVQSEERFFTFGPAPSVEVDADRRFVLTDVFGPVLVRLSTSLQGYAVESITVGSSDTTDVPFEFSGSGKDPVTITLTNRVGAIEGQVTGDDGEPARGAVVLVIPEDKRFWRMAGSRLRTIGLREGRFSAINLLPGRYHVIAVQGFAPGPNPSPEFFEPLVRLGTEVLVAEGEARTVELRVVREPER